MLNVLIKREVSTFMGAYTDTHVECFENVGASTICGSIFKDILRKREFSPFMGASTICGNIFKNILRKREVSPFMGAFTICGNIF